MEEVLNVIHEFRNQLDSLIGNFINDIQAALDDGGATSDQDVVTDETSSGASAESAEDAGQSDGTE